STSPTGTDPGSVNPPCTRSWVTPAVSLAELPLAFKLRQLELRAGGASRREHGAVERAFNILARPELRACYDSLLKDPSAPALFPYGGSDVLRHTNPLVPA